MTRIHFCCGTLTLLASSVLAQSAPSISGVWRANLEESKFAQMKPSEYLMIVQQQGNTVRESIGDTNMMGTYRSAFTFNTAGQESRNSWRGLPMRSKAEWTEGALIIDSRVAGQNPLTFHDKYSLSADGNTLTIATDITREGKESHQTIVLTRQPNEAGEPLRQPEETAGKRFKNVKLLADMPASRFLDAMSTFSMALGTRCDLCHVQGDFASDDKKEKVTARHMIEMTHGINEQSFDGRSEVHCYTCHHGSEKPQSVPE